MKQSFKRYLSMTAALLALAVLCACGRTVCPPTPDDTIEEVPPQAPAEDPVQIHDSVWQDEDGTSLVECSLRLPQPEELPEICQYYAVLASAVQETCELEQTDAKADRAARGEAFQPHTYGMDYEITRRDDRVFSVLRTETYSAGGESVVSYGAETFAAESQGMLLLRDLFSVKEEAYLTRMMELVSAQMAQRKAEGAVYYENAEEDLLRFYDPANFYLTEDSLVVFFGGYDLCYQSAEAQFFLLPLEELSDILNKAWF